MAGRDCSYLFHPLELFASLDERLVPGTEIGVSSRALSLLQQLLRVHTREFCHFVLRQEGAVTHDVSKSESVENIVYLPQVVDLNVQLLHAAVDLLAAGVFAIDSEGVHL